MSLRDGRPPIYFQHPSTMPMNRCDFLPKYTQIHHKILFTVLVKGSIWIIFHKKNSNFINLSQDWRVPVIKMINFITIINIDTPTWPLPTNTNVPKHTQNSYGIQQIYFLHFYLFILFCLKKNRNKSKTWPLTTNKQKSWVCHFL